MAWLGSYFGGEMFFWIAVALLLIIMGAYYTGRGRAVASVSGKYTDLHSLPSYHGYYVALWAGLPAAILTTVWFFAAPQILEGAVLSNAPESVTSLPPEQLQVFMADVRAIAQGGIPSRVTPEREEAAAIYASYLSLSNWAILAIALSLAVAGLTYARTRIHPRLRTRNGVETVVSLVLIICSTIAILTTVGIVFSLLFEALRFFARVPFTDFLFGLQWSPQTAIRADQVGGSGEFGAVPIFAGTFLITIIAMFVAVPIGLMSAIYLSDYASNSVRSIVKPMLEILAGVPTVVYGFFAALTVAPALRAGGASIGLDVASESALAAGLVMGVMIIPFVSSLSDDVINAVPQSLRDASAGLGATNSETIRNVILPAALPGIVGAILLAVSRAIGETMIVVMAAGLSANLTANPLEAVTTVTVQIVTLLVGDQEFDSAKTLAAFALGLTLFVVTLVLNVIALRIVQRYREKYD